jgi:hypothetical protein
VQAYPYPVVVSAASSAINPGNIVFPVPIGTRVAPCPVPARPTLYDLMPSGQYADNTVQNGPTLVSNPSFEAGNTGWTNDGGWTITTGPSYAGTYSAQRAASGTQSALRNAIQIAVVPGQIVIAQGMVSSTAGADGTCYCRVSLLNSSGVEFGDLTGNAITASTSWVQSRVVATMPAGTAFARLEFVAGGGTTGTYYVDAANLAYSANSLAEVPDASGRYAAVEISSNNTALHAASAQVAPSGDDTLSTSYAGIPGVSWSANSYGTSDKWNVTAAIMIQNQSSSLSATINLGIWDGNTAQYGQIQVVVPPGVYSFAVPLSCSFSGLAAGAHTILIKVSCTIGSAILKQLGTYAILQHVY